MDFTFLVMLCSSLVSAEPEPSPRMDVGADVLVFCDPGLEPALAPWLRYRQDQGHRLAVVTNYGSAQDIKRTIQSFARGGRLSAVVLVGDASPQATTLVSPPAHVPTHRTAARINVRWGSEPEIATDNWYADLNDDAVPEVAIGRLPAGTADELTSMIDKILTYERTTAAGLWRRRVNLVAGVGGFGPLADAVLETATRTFIGRGIPPEFRTSMTYASWRSPYCPDPRQFRQTVIDRLNEGCLCWIYIGHGHRRGLDWIRVPTGAAPILRSQDVAEVRATDGMPIAVFLSCYSGAFDHTEDCLGECLLVREGGPVAVLAGSRVTMPYGMAVLSSGLMNQMFHQRRETLGEVVLNAKQQMMDDQNVGFDRRLLNMLASAISPNPDDLEGERREHLYLFNLLGDPLLRIRYPRTVDVRTARSIESGKSLPVEFRSQVQGQCLVELVCRRGRFTYQPTPRTRFDGSSEGMRALTDEYHRANDDRFVTRHVLAAEPPCRVTIPVPLHASGHCQVRIFISSDEEYAMGSAHVFVEPSGDSAAGVVDDSAEEPSAAPSGG